VDTIASILFRSIFVDNLALSFLLGMCTFLAISRRLENAIGLGIAVIGVQTLSVPLNYIVFNQFLAPGAWRWLGLDIVDLSYLKFIVFIGVIASFVQVLEIVLERYFVNLHRSLGVYLPLLTVNCAILGGSLFMVQRDYNFNESVAWGFGSGVGWALAIILFAALRERVRYSDAPRAMQGLGMTFLLCGFLSLAFTSLRGLAG
jgi:Na+-transporting NADH:ubiquinone oxidoreductase subunit E